MAKLVIPPPELQVGSHHIDDGEKPNHSTSPHVAPNNNTIRQHDGARMRNVGLDPRPDGREKLGVAPIVHRRKCRVAAGMAMDLDEAEPIDLSLLHQQLDVLGLPVHPVTFADAVIMRNEVEVSCNQPIPLGPASSATGDERDCFQAVAWK